IVDWITGAKKVGLDSADKKFLGATLLFSLPVFILISFQMFNPLAIVIASLATIAIHSLYNYAILRGWLDKDANVNLISDVKGDAEISPMKAEKMSGEKDAVVESEDDNFTTWSLGLLEKVRDSKILRRVIASDVEIKMIVEEIKNMPQEKIQRLYNQFSNNSDEILNKLLSKEKLKDKSNEKELIALFMGISILAVLSYRDIMSELGDKDGIVIAKIIRDILVRLRYEFTFESITGSFLVGGDILFKLANELKENNDIKITDALFFIFSHEVMHNILIHIFKIKSNFFKKRDLITVSSIEFIADIGSYYIAQKYGIVDRRNNFNLLFLEKYHFPREENVQRRILRTVVKTAGDILFFTEPHLVARVQIYRMLNTFGEKDIDFETYFKSMMEVIKEIEEGDTKERISFTTFFLKVMQKYLENKLFVAKEDMSFKRKIDLVLRIFFIRMFFQVVIGRFFILNKLINLVTQIKQSAIHLMFKDKPREIEIKDNIIPVDEYSLKEIEKLSEHIFSISIREVLKSVLTFLGISIRDIVIITKDVVQQLKLEKSLLVILKNKLRNLSNLVFNKSLINILFSILNISDDRFSEEKESAEEVPKLLDGEELETSHSGFEYFRRPQYKSLDEAYKDLPRRIKNLLLEFGFTKEEIRVAMSLIGLIRTKYKKINLSTDYYHNHLHTLVVTHNALLLARQSGYSDLRDIKILFLSALLHDFHIREAGTPAKVDETIRQLRDILGLPLTTGSPEEKKYGEMISEGDKEKMLSVVRNFLGLSARDSLEPVFVEIEAIIRRTDFPFEKNNDNINKYKNSLRNVIENRRNLIDRIGVMIAKGADQSGSYWLFSYELVEEIVKGLAKEFKEPEERIENFLNTNYEKFFQPVLLDDSVLNVLYDLPI
ncbi:MAG: hypothetical protein SNJ64_06780, partial [Endomicrobiia bacterium]